MKTLTEMLAKLQERPETNASILLSELIKSPRWHTVCGSPDYREKTKLVKDTINLLREEYDPEQEYFIEVQYRKHIFARLRENK